MNRPLVSVLISPEDKLAIALITGKKPDEPNIKAYYLNSDRLAEVIREYYNLLEDNILLSPRVCEEEDKIVEPIKDLAEHIIQSANKWIVRDEKTDLSI